MSKTLSIVELILTVLQFIICKFTFAFILTVVARILFYYRLKGMKIPVKVLWVLEIIGVVLLPLIPLVLGWRVSIKGTLYALFAGVISILMMLYDDYAWVYVERKETKKW